MLRSQRVYLATPWRELAGFRVQGLGFRVQGMGFSRCLEALHVMGLFKV